MHSLSGTGLRSLSDCGWLKHMNRYSIIPYVTEYIWPY